MAGAALGLPVVGLLVADANDSAAGEPGEDRGGGPGTPLIDKPQLRGDRVAGRHPVTVGIPRRGVEHHVACGDPGRERLQGIERAFVDPGQAGAVEELPEEGEKVVAGERFGRIDRHPAGDRDSDDPTGIGRRWHRWIQRSKGRDAPCRGA